MKTTLLKKFLTVAAAAALTSSFAAVRTIITDEVLTVTDATVGDYADGFAFADETGVVEFDTSAAPTMDITGKGTVMKISDSDWTMSKELTNFYGTYVLAGSGIVTVNQYKRTFFGQMDGKARGPLVVKAGTTIDVVNTDAWNDMFDKVVVRIAGTGKNGAGAIRTLYTTKTMSNNFRWLVLDDDASINLVTGNDTWFLLGHGDGYIQSADDTQKTLTLSGPGTLQVIPSFCVKSNVAIRVTGSGRFAVRDEDATHKKVALEPSVTDPITLEGSGIFNLYNLIWGTAPDYLERATKAVDRPLVVKSASAELRLTSRYDSGQLNNRLDRTDDTVNNVRGDVTLESGSKLTTMVEWFEQLQFSGHLLGSGELALTSANSSRGRVYVSSTNSTFTGKVTVGSNNSYHPALLLGAPGTLPDYTKVTVGSGYVGLDLRHWDVASVRKFANEANYSGINGSSPAYVGLDTTFSGGETVPFCYPGFDTVLPVGGCTAGTILLTNVVTTAATPLRITQAGGTMVVKDEGRPIYVGDTTRLVHPIEIERTEPSIISFENADLRMGTTSPKVADLFQTDRSFYFVVPKIVISNSTLIAENRRADYSDLGTDALLVAGQSGDGPYGGGALEILDDSVVSSKLVVAGSAYYGKGAVYQRGGSVTALGSATSWDNSSCIGAPTVSPWTSGNTHGYYELSGGTFTALGRFSLGLACGASWFQSGGLATFGKALGSDAQPLFQIGSTVDSSTSQATSLEMYISGGTFDVGPEMEAGANKEVGFAGYGAQKWVQITVDGDGALLDFRNKHLMGLNGNTSRAHFNIVNDGVLRANSINFANAVADGCVNFNGGTFKVYGESVDLFHRHAAWPDTRNVFVYENGATVETSGTDVRMSTPVKGPVGQGVTAITMSAPITGISYPPQVVIDGDGFGAAAVCVYDSKTSTISGIKLLCPGSGYTKVDAYLQWGYGMKVSKANNKDFSLTATLGDVSNTGDFTKAGAGCLDLYATNTWGGATIVKGGVLKARCDWAIPTNSPVVLAGGDINFNGKTCEVASVTYGAGGGQILNAANVKLPGTAEMAISAEDIANGKKVEMTGSVDLSKFTLTVSGDGSGLSPDARYTIATTTGGTFSGTPSGVTLDPSLAKWRVKVYPTKITMSIPRGMVIIVR